MFSPLYPPESGLMSDIAPCPFRCQYRKWLAHHSITSSARAAAGRNFEPKRPSASLEIDHKLEFGRLLSSVVLGGPLALENSVDVAGRAAGIARLGTTHKTPGRVATKYRKPEAVGRRCRTANAGNQFPMRIGDGTR